MGLYSLTGEAVLGQAVRLPQQQDSVWTTVEEIELASLKPGETWPPVVTVRSSARLSRMEQGICPPLRWLEACPALVKAVVDEPLDWTFATMLE